MKNPIRWLALGSILSGGLFLGCEDLGIPPPILPSIVSFRASPKSILEGDTVLFRMRATADNGLARGIIDYRDGTKRDTVKLSGNRDSAQTSHTYLVPGIFKPALTLEDAAGEKAVAFDSVFVRANQLPQVVNLLTGTEGKVSRASRRALASDPEGDSLTISVSPVSPGLVFQMNARKDSVIYFLTNRDDNGTKQGKITVIDQKNRTVEKVIDIVFAPLDDINGRVHDRFEGTYLASYKPVVVMQGPFTGWVAAIKGTDTVKVSVDANGNYALPKLSSVTHILRAFITNGTDSSFVANYQLSPGDQTFDIGVETNAGTGMPVARLLSLYQIVNYRNRDGMGSPGWLTGINLKNNASHYVYYLLGKDTSSTWLNAKHFTAEQQNWFESEIQARCFAHLPPANRPRIVKAGPSDPVPLRGGSIGGYPIILPYDGYVIVYANLIQTVSAGRSTLWDERYDGLYDCAQIAFNGGDDPAPPYGFSIVALVQQVGSSISGNGLLQDPYYSNKSTRAEHTVLDLPSVADMKLDWQVVFEIPGEFSKTNTEAKYFEMPE
jgi:hypothetical protein